MAFATLNAGATAQMRLSDGTPAGTITITDNGPGDVDPTVGQIFYIGPVGANWNVNAAVGSTYPKAGTPTTPIMDLNVNNDSAAAGTLTIDWSDSGFTAGGAAALSIGGISDGTVTYQVWTDPGNTNFGQANLVSTVGPLVGGGGTISGTGTGTVPLVSPYSMTMEMAIQHPGAGSTGFDAQLIVTPPSCNCSLNFTSPAAFTNCFGDTIPDAVATQDCGGGPVPAIVTVTGLVTNGVCPSPMIITRTNSATDGCNVVHTFVQTITVNCLPDCTITPSVTTAVVGATNLNAWVADAGPGATYTWNILNGTIISGQGTTNITFNAGTNANNPITITVKVVNGNGCQNNCTASVRLLPPPPQNVGPGDTATIGFWHNKNGQGLILGAPNSPALGNWLGSNFPCLFGNLAGKPNSVVAAAYMTDFNVSGQKTYAQVFAGALACYFTSSNLAGSGASKFGFNITPGGTGAKAYNVGSYGTAIGLQNNTSYTVLQLLQAADANCPFGNKGPVFDALNIIFDGINQSGDIK